MDRGYSVEEIYGIQNAGKYSDVKQTYNSFYRLYNIDPLPSDNKMTMEQVDVICEVVRRCFD